MTRRSQSREDGVPKKKESKTWVSETKAVGRCDCRVSVEHSSCKVSSGVGRKQLCCDQR